MQKKIFITITIRVEFRVSLRKKFVSDRNNARKKGMSSAARETKRHRAEIPINDDAPIPCDS